MIPAISLRLRDYISSFSLLNLPNRPDFGCVDAKMDSCEFEDEKANVLHRYKLFRNVSSLFHLIELLIAVALISRSSSRVIAVLKSSGDNLLTFSSHFLNHRVVFLVGNVIIFLCYLLSRYTDDGNRSEKYDAKYSSLNRRKTTEDASIGESVTVTPPPEESMVTEETSGEEKPNEELDFKNDAIKTVSETQETSGEEKPNADRDYETDAVLTASETAIKQAVKQIERFRRIQSEKLKREMSIKPHRELRRSVTAESSFSMTSGDENLSETVEELSNEEFQIAVETFILKQQSFLKQEGMAENGTEL